MRYLVLVLLNTPIILVSIINIVTQYKLGKISASRLRHQLLALFCMLIVLIGSFPVYNLLSDKPLFDSSELSLFDIVEITAIISLLTIVNNQRQRLDQADKRLRDLHQSLSIRLSN